MLRIPAHTLDSAPATSRPFLETLLSGPSGLGRILNLQAQLAHAPVLLAAYAGIRKAIEEHATLEFTTRSAIQLTVSTVDDAGYSTAINSMLARRAGWSDDDIATLRAGDPGGNPKLDALLAVVREAATTGGRVADETWSAAADAGWSDTELAESYIYLALTRFVDDFVVYAGTELDLPAVPAHA